MCGGRGSAGDDGTATAEAVVVDDAARCVRCVAGLVASNAALPPVGRTFRPPTLRGVSRPLCVASISGTRVVRVRSKRSVMEGSSPDASAFGMPSGKRSICGARALSGKTLREDVLLFMSDIDGAIGPTNMPRAARDDTPDIPAGPLFV